MSRAEEPVFTYHFPIDSFASFTLSCTAEQDHVYIKKDFGRSVLPT